MALDPGWAALVSLVEPSPGPLAADIAEWPVAVRLVDFQDASIELMRDYRNGALRVIAISVLLILASCMAG